MAAGGTAGVATVVRTIRSAPRQPGATMVVAPDGTVAGSVSGGCVEAAVYELASEVVASGRAELQRYGVTDDDAFAVGLTCGGIIDIFAEPMSRETFPQLQAIADDIAAHRPTAIATVIAHPDPARIGRRLVIGQHAVDGSLGSARADAAVTDDARGLLAAGQSTVLSYGPDGQRQDTGMEVFVASHAPRPRMVIFGAIDFASALARQGAFLGYRVTVCERGRCSPLRHGSRPPTRWSSPGPTATSPNRPNWAPSTRGPRSVCSPTTPSSTSGPAGRAATARGRLHRRDGFAAHPRRPDRPAARGRGDRRRAEPTIQPYRPRPGRAHTRGNRRVDRRGDHRAALGRRRSSA